MDRSAALAAFAALSQETRLETFRLLVKAGPAGRSAGAIAEQLGVRQNTLSSHLGILLAAGLVGKRRDGRSIVYAADFAGLRALLTYLLEECCGSDRAACSPLIASIIRAPSGETS